MTRSSILFWNCTMLQSKIPNDVMSQRQQYLNSVMQFIQERNEKLTEVLQRLGICSEVLSEVERKQVCPYNKDHVVPEKSFKKHVNVCKLLGAGYQRDELPALTQDVDFCYENADSVLRIDIDENLLNKIIWDHSIQNGQVYTGHRTMPVSHIDENINLTQEDRLAVYRHVVAKSHEAGKVIPVDRSDDLLTTDWGSLVKKGLLDEQNNKKYSSKLEQLAALRDLKRRRQSYRAKNVHITKKSYTEIIREVISNQMEILTPEGNVQAKPTTSSEDLEYGRSESWHRDHQESSRSRGRDYSSKETHRERYRGYDDDDADRSRDRYRGKYQGSTERQRSRDRSQEKYRDKGVSRSSQRSRDTSRERRRNQDSPSSWSRGFTEADEMLLKEIKREMVEDGNPSGKGMEKHNEVQDETVSEGERYYEKYESSRKRSRSESDSDGSSKKQSRHKKSKHKKKHSKKHKRKD